MNTVVHTIWNAPIIDADVNAWHAKKSIIPRIKYKLFSAHSRQVAVPDSTADGSLRHPIRLTARDLAPTYPAGGRSASPQGSSANVSYPKIYGKGSLWLLIHFYQYI